MFLMYFKISPSSDEKFPEPKGSFFDNQERVVEKLRSMALAHETQDKEGEFKEYVEACITTTHGLKLVRYGLAGMKEKY